MGKYINEGIQMFSHYSIPMKKYHDQGSSYEKKKHLTGGWHTVSGGESLIKEGIMVACRRALKQ